MDAAAAWDSVRNQLVVFGGFDGQNNVLNDTWTWNGSWVEHPVNGPSPRRQAAMAFDPENGLTVLYGGWAASHFYDTWLWDGTSWQVANPAHTPSINGVMAFDPTSHSILLWGFAGSAYPPADAETWKWSGSDWVQLDVQPAGSPMLKLDGYQFVLSPDPASGRVVLVGHTSCCTPNTWDWDGTKWTLLGQVGPQGYQFNLAADPAVKAVVAEDNVATWIWDGARWTQLSVSGGPGHLQEASLAFDSRDQVVLLFGGLNPDVAYGTRNNLWSWDGQSWAQLT
ncbi:MAG TPA: kelch repeat-containing protein [Candidatus Dormibacteraeota bacterium]|nr:kelch repeat-containing protein [Candidatus Dormibacteraeota bacterium]